MLCRSFSMSTRLCKEACALLCAFLETLVFSRIACCIYKQNNKKRSAGDDDHETAKKVIKKGISRKWIALVGERKTPVD
jgi:hypothetical protein